MAENKDGSICAHAPVSKIGDARLKKELVKVAKVYYASGKSGISFGGTNTDLAAEALGSRKMGRGMMERFLS